MTHETDVTVEEMDEHEMQEEREKILGGTPDDA